MKTVRYGCLGFICFGLLTFLSSVSNGSQPYESAPTPERNYWVNFGSGFASVPRGLGEDDGGLSIGASLSCRNGSNLFSLRWITNAEFNLDIWGNSGPAETVWDIGVLYGRVAKTEHSLFSMAAGAGIVGASDDGHNRPLYAGIPIEAQLFWTPNPTLGFGIHGFADFNSYKSFGGILFCVQLGREL